ncbi:hypothetical protein [Streptomyces noursei]|uniref:hypothetical protein n=1 Tax=Streptomyces noursei TaxID=1971 RepID=UPI0016741405|nr:hypothetical protein [Streptomyces noursei]MCZ1021416.1 hypothetical protein [Streptomyces noursei]GGX46311.1 hypothetical protein GCM10010341_80030 [Streptomyces noursei]
MSATSDDKTNVEEQGATSDGKPKRKRGKARAFDFTAIEHVGNDATEGGFLGDDAAEAERRAGSGANATTPSEKEEAATRELHSVKTAEQPAGEGSDPALEMTVEDTASSVSLPAQTSGAATASAPSEEQGTSPSATHEPATPSDPATTEASTKKEGRPAAGQRRNDGPGFSAASAEPTLKPRRKKAGSPKPMQAAVLDSFIAHRTARNWITWSGRIEGETKVRLLDKADDDAASSKRNLMPGHYLDAALRRISSLSPQELASLANHWLIEKWSGEHPPGVSIQAGVSPEMHEFLKGLKRTMRGQRGTGGGGIILDVVSAAVDRFLDDADEEGPFPSVR